MKSGFIERRRLLDVGWMEGLPLILNFVSLAANGYIIRTLGAVEYGSLVVATGLSGATAILSNLGIRALYTKAIAGADNERLTVLIKEQLALRFFLAFAAGFLAIGAAGILYRNDLVVIACTAIQSAGLLATISWTVLADVLNSREMFRRNANIAFLAGLCLTAFSVLAAAVGLGPIGVAVAYLLGPLSNVLLQWRAVQGLGIRIEFGWVPVRRYYEMLREARALAANDLVRSFVGRAEGVWAPLLLGKATIGTISAGSLPTDRLGHVNDGVATAYFPSMAAAHNRGDNETLARQATAMFTLMLAVAIPLALFAFVAAPYFAALLFPAEDQLGARELCTFVTRVTAIAIPITTINSGMRYTVQAFGLHSRNAKQQIVASVIGAIAALGLAVFLGAEGLVVAIIVRGLLLLLLQGRLFAQHFTPVVLALPWPILLGLWVPLGVFTIGLLGVSGKHPLWLAIAISITLVGGYLLTAARLGLLERKARTGTEG